MAFSGNIVARESARQIFIIRFDFSNRFARVLIRVQLARVNVRINRLQRRSNKVGAKLSLARLE